MKQKCLSCRDFSLSCSFLLSLSPSLIVSKGTPDSDNDTTCLELKADEGFRLSTQNQKDQQKPNSRPSSLCEAANGLDNAATQCKKWVETVSVPLMMAYITRYIFVS